MMSAGLTTTVTNPVCERRVNLSRNPVYARRVESSTLVFSLSSHRQSYAGLVFNCRFMDS
jgi:hypothetical protein